MLSHSSQDSVRDVLRRQLTRVMEQEMADWVRRGQQIQAFRQDVPADFLAQAVLGILFALVTRWHVEGHLPWDQDDVIRLVNRLLNDR
ncbi:MAG: TetR/AcrR family transcriptional regulator, partial [Sulfobacillus sp.]|nr:TetR/AcrR family transcriptional regulator [Sulfobacillus sp.]